MLLGWNVGWPLAQELWESEYNKFIAELSSFVNKEMNDFQK